MKLAKSNLSILNPSIYAQLTALTTTGFDGEFPKCPRICD